MKICKVGVVGSRRRNESEDKNIIRKALQHFIAKAKATPARIFLVSGGCPLGADRFAEELATELGLQISIHYPDKSKLEAQERWAYAKINYERNTLIAEECDILIALPVLNSPSGTDDTIRKAVKLNKPVVLL